MVASTARPLLNPVGSAAWNVAEKENVANMMLQEMEEVQFPLRNELEFVYEYMAGIYSSDHGQL